MIGDVEEMSRTLLPPDGSALEEELEWARKCVLCVLVFWLSFRLGGGGGLCVWWVDAVDVDLRACAGSSVCVHVCLLCVCLHVCLCESVL